MNLVCLINLIVNSLKGTARSERIVSCRKLWRKALMLGDVKATWTYRCDSWVLTISTRFGCCARSPFQLSILWHGENSFKDKCIFLLICWWWFAYLNRYEEITTNSSRFYSLAAVYNCAIVGLLVAEIKSWSKLNKEDRTILSESLGRSSSLAYILSLGVHRKYRRNGIATTLLETFMEHLQSSEQNSKIKAIYLHVLTTNQPAIVFYERYKWVRSSLTFATCNIKLFLLSVSFFTLSCPITTALRESRVMDSVMSAT